MQAWEGAASTFFQIFQQSNQSKYYLKYYMGQRIGYRSLHDVLEVDLNILFYCLHHKDWSWHFKKAIFVPVLRS